LASKNNYGFSHPKLKTYISELILGSYEYKPIVKVTMHCMICTLLKWLPLSLRVEEVSLLHILTAIRSRQNAN